MGDLRARWKQRVCGHMYISVDEITRVVKDIKMKHHMVL